MSNSELAVMQELQIPNGYFQLWNMYLIEQGIDFHQLGFLAPYQYESGACITTANRYPITIFVLSNDFTTDARTVGLSAVD